MKIALILPYFGNFDNLYPIWLQSCKYNPNIDWIIFTDDKTSYNYPQNVKVHYTEFEKIKKHFQTFYDFKISLDNPYRLCNFKPAYGELFSNYIQGYDAWGFCDNDMIYGNINKDIPETSNNRFQIGKFGHLTILPNTEECRILYRYADAYKIAFSTPQPLFFDENTFLKILAKNGYEVFPLHIAELKVRIKHFNVQNFNNYKAQCFVWNDGKLERYYSEDGKNIKREEFTYIHFLKRPITIENGIDITKPLIIIPNKIFNMPLNEITPEFLLAVNKAGIFFNYWKNSFKPKNLYIRIINRLYQNKKNRLFIENMNRLVAEK